MTRPKRSSEEDRERTAQVLEGARRGNPEGERRQGHRSSNGRDDRVDSREDAEDVEA